MSPLGYGFKSLDSEYTHLINADIRNFEDNKIKPMNAFSSETGINKVFDYA